MIGLKSMNAASDSPIENEDLARDLRIAWRQLQDDVAGLDSVEESRNIALDASSSGRQVKEDIRASLHPVAEDVLRFIASKYAGPRIEVSLDPFDTGPTFADVCRHLATDDKLRVQHRIDNLLDAELIRTGISGHYKEVYNVTAKGRAYLVENDLV